MHDTHARVDDLLAPVSLSTFAREYWVRRPLYVEGSPAKLEHLFGAAPSLSDLLEIAARAKGPPTRVSAFFQNRAVQRRRDEVDDLPRMDASAPQIRALLAAGATVSVYNVDAVEPELARWAERLRTTLQHPGRTTCSLWMSSPGVGMYTHYDTFSSLHVQLVGSKVWRLSPVVQVEAPHSAAVLRGDGTADVDVTGFDPQYEPIDPSSFLTITMKPGDVLFAPAGAWHHTECASDEISVSAAFEPRYVGFQQLLATYLNDHFATDARWRYLPLAPLDDPRAADELDAFFSARLDEAIAALQRVRERRFELAKAWQRSIAANGVIEELDSPRPAISATVSRDDVLRPPAGKPLTCAAGEDRTGRPAMFVYQAGEVISFDDPALFDFARRLARAGEFRAGDACTWTAGGYTWEDVKALLDELVASAILDKMKEPR